MKRKHFAAFLDAILAFLMVFLLLPHSPAQDIVTVNPGSVVVRAVWPPNMDADIDLWVLAPGDRPVGYSNQSGNIFNLLRDDLGFARDVTEINEEFAFSRGSPAGEYVVNLHGYRLRSVATVPVQTTAMIVWPGRPAQILFVRLVNVEQGEEVTVARFSLNDTGMLRDMHDLPTALRNRQ